MKTYKLIAVILLAGLLGLANASAQKGIGNPTRWRIVSGPGAGIVLHGNGRFIGDADWEAEGHIADPDECDCVHYHGTLLGFDDPNPTSCGWGCVEEEPANAFVALGNLLLAIDDVAATDPALANKLDSILKTAATSASNNCNTLFLAAADAAGDELYAALSGQSTIPAGFENIIDDLVDYVLLALDAMQLKEAPTNEPPCCSVELLSRHGSGAAAKLFATKRKVNADVGEVVVFDAQSCPGGGPFKWDYKFKGETRGDVPSGSGISFSDKRFCVLSEQPTTVTVTVSFVCPNGKTVKDTVTVNIQ